MNSLHIKILTSETEPAVTILCLQGPLANDGIVAITKAFDDLLSRTATFVAADMSAVTMISSAVLGELMGGRRRLVEAGGDLVFCGLSLDQKTQLTMMGAHRIFTFYPDIRSAINAYAWSFTNKRDRFALSFPPLLSYVPAVRQMVSRLARKKGYSNRDAFRIETIVDEICNNAVEHRKNGSDENVGLSVEIGHSRIEIDVTGVSDPVKVENLKSFLKPSGENDPNFIERRGRGLALIQLLTNELNIQFRENGTSVRATKLREE